MESNGTFIFEPIKALGWIGIIYGLFGIINIIVKSDD
jgi:hypothetical protein